MRLLITAVAFTFSLNSLHAISVPVLSTIDDHLTYRVGNPLKKNSSSTLYLLSLANLGIGAFDAAERAYNLYNLFNDKKLSTANGLVGFINLGLSLLRTYTDQRLITSLTSGRMPNVVLTALPFTTLDQRNTASVLINKGFSSDEHKPNLLPYIIETTINILYISRINSKLTDNSSTSTVGGIIDRYLPTNTFYHLYKQWNSLERLAKGPDFTKPGKAIIPFLSSLIKDAVHSAASR